MADNTAAANEAAEKPAGPVKIRMPYRTDKFKIDDKTTITGEPQEFSATAAKKILEAAKAARVRLVVQDA